VPTPTVISVTQLGPVTGSVSIGKTTNGQEVRKYRVTFSALGANTADAINATTESSGSVPAFGVFSGPFMLTGKDASQVTEDGRLWDVVCTFTLPQPGEESKPADEAVTRWAINITFSGLPYQTEIQKNPADDKPILNKVGDPISGVMDTKYDETLNVAFTSTSGLFDVIDATKGKVNSTDLTITINGEEVTYPAGSLKFDDYSIEYTLDANGSTYPRLTLKFLYRVDGWTRKIANKGFRKLVSGKAVWILDDDGQPIREPVYLKADGSDKLAAGAVVNTIDLEPKTADFSGLFSGVVT
jgi:hypothetical protein